MEKPTRGQEYREGLAKDLKETRKEDPNLAQQILEEEKETTRYKMAETAHADERDEKQEIFIEKNKELTELQNQEEKISLLESKEIMGDQFLGPEEIKKVFGFEVENIPPILFTKEQLEKARDLGHNLVLYVDKFNNETSSPSSVRDIVLKSAPGWAQSINDNIRPGWRIVDSGFYSHHYDEIIHDNMNYRDVKYLEQHKNKPVVDEEYKDIFLRNQTFTDETKFMNYLSQSLVLAKHLRRMFAGLDMPKKYQEAIDEVEGLRATALVAKDENIVRANRSEARHWGNGLNTNLSAEKLVNLKINRLCRENMPEIIYRVNLSLGIVGDKHNNIYDDVVVRTSSVYGSRVISVEVGEKGNFSMDSDEPNFVNGRWLGGGSYGDSGAVFSLGAATK